MFNVKSNIKHQTFYFKGTKKKRRNLKLQCWKLQIVVQEHNNGTRKISFEVTLVGVRSLHKISCCGTNLRWVMYL